MERLNGATSTKNYSALFLNTTNNINNHKTSKSICTSESICTSDFANLYIKAREIVGIYCKM